MSIWVNKNTKVIVQGITGKTARYHLTRMIAYGTNVVAGVSPFKEGQEVEGVKVYNTCKDAVNASGGDTSVIFVPAPFAADAILEAADAGIKLIVCITEHIPFSDMVKVKHYLKDKEVRLIGPNCPGIITTDGTKLGIMPAAIHTKGHVGIVSRSGTLTYEAVDAVTKAGLGQSTAVGIGGDPINGTNFIDVLSAFNEDEDTHSVIMIGEIGGTAEQEAAEWVKENMTKPVVAFIAGQTAPKGKRMGHAGAIVSGKGGSAKDKVETLEKCGIKVAKTISQIVELLEK